MSEEKKESRPPAPDKNKIKLLQESKPQIPQKDINLSTEEPKEKPSKKESSDK